MVHDPLQRRRRSQPLGPGVSAQLGQHPGYQPLGRPDCRHEAPPGRPGGASGIAAAAGVTAILLGTAETVPELWPADVAEGPYLDKAVLLARAVAAAARPLHRLN